MKKVLVAIALIAFFIFATTLSSGSNINPEKGKIQLQNNTNKEHRIAKIYIFGEKDLKFEADRKISDILYFGAKITGTVQNEIHPMHVNPYALFTFNIIPHLFRLGYDITAGTTIVINCKVLFIRHFDSFEPLDMLCLGYGVEVTMSE